jgi:hypothetical protein
MQEEGKVEYPVDMMAVLIIVDIQLAAMLLQYIVDKGIPLYHIVNVNNIIAKTNVDSSG